MSIKNCQCEICLKRIAARQKIYQFAYLNKMLVVRIVLISIGWVLCYLSYNAIKDVDSIEEFIPHEILGISMEATVPEVKKAYRKMSREKHPDKNPDNPAAKAEFIQITKAYTVSKFQLFILTDFV